MKERSSAANSEPREEGGGFLSELTSFIIKGHSARRPQTVHVVSLCGSGKREKQSERNGVRVLSSDELKLVREQEFNCINVQERDILVAAALTGL